MQPYIPRGGPAGPSRPDAAVAATAPRRAPRVAAVKDACAAAGGGGGGGAQPLPSRRAALLAALLFSATAAAPAAARIETARLLSGSNSASTGTAAAASAPRPPPPRAAPASLLDDLTTARRRPTPPPPPPSTSSVAAAVARFTSATADARAAADRGDWAGAEAAYRAAIAAGPDLAIADLARVSRALVLRQLGDAPGARLALEDVEAALRGRAEVHAALAALRYEAKLPGAEEQWDLASEFDRRFADPAWVEKEKGWPPAMVGALRAFLELK